MIKTNKIIKWLEEQNQVNNKIFNTKKSFNQFLMEDICDEVLSELDSLFGSRIMILNIIEELKEDEAKYDETSKNVFIDYTVNKKAKIIKLKYLLKNNQSYTRHEAAAKKQLNNIAELGLLNIQELSIKRVHGKELREYIFTYR